jgi:hypothetical protein
MVSSRDSQCWIDFQRPYLTAIDALSSSNLRATPPDSSCGSCIFYCFPSHVSIHCVLRLERFRPGFGLYVRISRSKIEYRDVLQVLSSRAFCTLHGAWIISLAYCSVLPVGKWRLEFGRDNIGRTFHVRRKIYIQQSSLSATASDRLAESHQQ